MHGETSFRNKLLEGLLATDTENQGREEKKISQVGSATFMKCECVISLSLFA